MEEEKSCGVITFRDDSEREYLLLLYPPGHWGSPKGHVEDEEDERDTARRELAEETGIANVELYPGFRESITYTYKAGGKRRRKTVIFFLGRTETVDVTLSDEHDGYEWLGYDAARDRITYDDERAVFTTAHDHLESRNAQLDDFT